MGGIRPSVLAFIITLSVATSGAAAVQATDGNLVETSTQLAQDVEASFQGETAKQETEQQGLSAMSYSEDGFKIDPTNTCDDRGEILLAKYEAKDQDGDGDEEFVFTGEGIAGDVFNFDYVRPEGEILNFTWTSTGPGVVFAAGKIDGDQENDYNESFSPPEVGPEGAMRDSDPNSPTRAYSQVQFCGGDLFQIDFVSGSSTPDPLTESTFTRQNRLIEAVIGDASGNELLRGSQNADARKCIEVVDQISIDRTASPSEASITVKIKSDLPDDCDGQEFTFVAYDLPDSATGFATPQERADQVGFTIDTTSTDFDAGSEVELTVTLDNVKGTGS